MDFKILSKFVFALGVLVLVVGSFKFFQNQPLTPPPPPPTAQFSWDDFMKRSMDPTQNQLGVALLNQKRARLRADAAKIMGVGALIIFAATALWLSAKKNNSS